MELWELSREQYDRLVEIVGADSDLIAFINSGAEIGEELAEIIGDSEFFDTVEDLITSEIANSHTDESGQSTEAGEFLEDILMSLAMRMPITEETPNIEN